jgi:chemotaxis protein methyltransferase WspC
MTVESPADFQGWLSEWLLARYGLDLRVLGSGSLEDAVGVRSRELGLAHRGEYAARWAADAAEREALLDRLLVGETWFFREWPAFEALAAWVTPRAGDFTARAPLRVLTLPCATGEEAWSIAAVLHEAGLDARRVTIDAMDISPSAIQTALEGLYPQRKLRSQPLERWAGLLCPEEGARLRVDPRLRGMVHFTEANAMNADFLLKRDPYHAIFCRNMLIYMSEEARRHICGTLARCLRPGGLLFVGHAEIPPAGLGLIRTPFDGAFAWTHQPTPGLTPPANPVKPAMPPVKPVAKPTAPRPGMARIEAPRLPNAVDAAPVRITADSSSAPSAPGPNLAPLRELANLGRYAEALKLLDTTEASQSLDPDLHALAGVVLSAMGQAGEAENRLRRALFLRPNHPECLAHLALLLEKKGDVAEAARLRTRLAAEASGAPT